MDVTVWFSAENQSWSAWPSPSSAPGRATSLKCRTSFQNKISSGCKWTPNECNIVQRIAQLKGSPPLSLQNGVGPLWMWRRCRLDAWQEALVTRILQPLVKQVQWWMADMFSALHSVSTSDASQAKFQFVTVKGWSWKCCDLWCSVRLLLKRGPWARKTNEREMHPTPSCQIPLLRVKSCANTVMWRCERYLTWKLREVDHIKQSFNASQTTHDWSKASKRQSG